jgi:predicted nuclease with RNAse H fold
MTTVVGLDLAGKTTDRTVMAVATSPAGGRPSFDLVSRTADGHRLPDVSGLADMLSGYSPDLVAIDAPLSLPHQVVCADGACRRCFGEEADGSYTQRAADRADHWTEIGHVEKPPMPTVMLAGVAFRAIYLNRLLAARDVAVIETWPTGVLRALGAAAAPRKREEGAYVVWARAALDGAGFEVPALTRTTDEVDAVAAAVAAWEHVAGRTVGVGDDEGRIWVPDRRVADA